MKHQVDTLMQQMNDNQPAIRRLAALELGKIAGDGELTDRREVIGRLIHLLADGELAVRDAAEETLVAIGSPDVVDALIPCLFGPSTTVLNAAIDILSRIGYASIDAIRALLESKDHDIRKFGCDILGNLRHGEAVYDLIDLLNDPHVNVAIAAGEALGKIRSPEAVPYLIRALQHPDTWMRCIAAEALGKIGDCRAVEPFIAMSAYEDPIVLYTVMKAMGNLNDARVLPYILSILESNPIFAPSAAQAIQSLAMVQGDEVYRQVNAAGVHQSFIRLLQSENREIVRSAIHLLGRLQRPEAVQPIARFLEHQDEQMVSEAIHALLRFGPLGAEALRQAAPHFRRLLDQSTDAGVRATVQQALSVGSARLWNEASSPEA